MRVLRNLVLGIVALLGFQNVAPSPFPEPQIVATIAPTSATAAVALTTLYTPAIAGYYRICGALAITATTDTSGTIQTQFEYTWDAHLFGPFGTTSSVTATTQWNTSNASNAPVCQAFYSDAATPIKYEVTDSGAGGTATYLYWFTLEQLP